MKYERRRERGAGREGECQKDVREREKVPPSRNMLNLRLFIVWHL